MSKSNSQSGSAELLAFVERYEQLDSERAAVAAHMKEVMSEAKARGYNTKVLRKLIAERRRDKDDVAEEEAILDLYRAALANARDEAEDDSGMV